MSCGNLIVHFLQIKRSSPSEADRMRLERRNETILQGYAKKCKCVSVILSSAEIIKTKGLEHVTVDDLVAEITPKGRGTLCANGVLSHVLVASVPDVVKAELLQRIRKFLTTSS